MAYMTNSTEEEETLGNLSVSSAQQPLLSTQDNNDDEYDVLYPPRHCGGGGSGGGNTTSVNGFSATYARCRRRARDLLSSRFKHYFIVALVSLDVTAILAEIFIALVACDLGQKDAAWTEKTKEVLHPVALALTCLFVAELSLSVWAFGLEFFDEWFHCLDALVIVVSFVVDLFVRGVVEDIVSIVIVLRLWRLVKIVQEVSVGAAERMEELEARVVQLEKENHELRNS